MARSPKKKATKEVPVISAENMSELGTIGLNMGNGVITEESVHQALTWPNSKTTFNTMSYDPTISAVDQTVKAFVRKAIYEVGVKSLDPTDEQLDQNQLIEECMEDMEAPFVDYLCEALSIMTYGFSVHYKIFKYRNQRGKYGSLFDDGRVGWAELPIRSQDTIREFKFDAEGRHLEFVIQDLNLVNHLYSYGADSKAQPLTSEYKMKRKRLLHFRHDVRRNNPEGRSPLRSCYEPWRYKQQIERFQAIGISRDLGGIPIMRLPAEYMSPNATDDKVAVYEMFKNIVRNLQFNEQAGLVLPTFYDDNSNQLFDFELLSNTGTKQYDTNAIINSYENKILMTYMADILKLGQDASGSLALSDNKSTLLTTGIKAIIDEILQEFNNDLIPQTLVMNGYKLSRDMPKIKLKEIDEVSLEELGDFVQKVSAAGMMEADEGAAEHFRYKAGMPAVDRTKPLKPEMTAGADNEIGDGLKKGMPNTNGTATKAKASTGNAST